MSTRMSAELIAHITGSVQIALAEDIGSGDLTAGLVPGQQQAHGRIVSRDAAVICGQPWVKEVFRQLDPSIVIEWHVGEGDSVGSEQVLCEVQGAAQPLLTGERTALNFLQILSAVASATRVCVDAINGTRAQVLDTRKTIPGLRLAQKYAVRIGGGTNHRMGLYDGILVKENHIVAAGGITSAVRRAREQSVTVLLEVEVENLAQAEEAMAAGADRLLLDNFEVPRIRDAVALRDRLSPRTTLEASGGINFETLRPVAETGVDFISIGALTKNVRAVDLSMRFEFR
ncbi:MAG: carboxylating nicotinate-nucleotide diphosphorylase [Gammaproteobacteria bacterium]